MSSELDALRSEDALTSWPYKRVVVDINKDGKSFIQTEKATSVIKKPGFFHRGDLWCTKEMPVDNTIPGDRSQDLVTRDPFPCGVNFRALMMYPETGDDKEQRIAENKDLHRRVQQKHMPSEEDYQRHPSMHRTDTVDFISVVSGEMYLMTDLDEVLMKPGDSVVIRGVNHAWSNRGTEPCLTIGGMVDAKEFDLYGMEPIEVDMEHADEAIKSWPYKRIVVGSNADGKSYTMTTQVSRVIKKENFHHRADLWCTKECPVDNTIEGDRALEMHTRDPYPRGTVFRSLIMYPESKDRAQHAEVVRELHEQMQQKHMPTAADYQRHPTMHRTDTLDYIFVVKGEIYMMTDTDEVLMKPGDAVVIKGGNHAWSNRSDEPCLLIGVMTDALPRE